MKDKVVVVTGGASGIGSAICRKFAKEGSKIAIIDFDQKALDKELGFLRKSGANAIGKKCDITDEKACTDAVNSIINHCGGIDILVNNAGITQRSAFVDTKISAYRKVMEVNFFGSLICTKAAINSIIKRKGSIVVTSSIAGITPLPGRTGYSASKHALHGLFETLRTEVAHLGVNILLLCPGFTKTNLQTRAIGEDGNITKHKQSTTGKIDTPEHVADLLYKAVKKRKKILILTFSGKGGNIINKFFPELYEKIIVKKFKNEFDG